MKRLGLLLVVLLVGVAFMASAATTAKPALKLLGISRWNPNPTWAPADTAVQKAMAAAANAYAGRTVTVDWGNYPPETTYIQFLQMREAAGNLPEILLLDDLHNNAEAYEYAIKKGLIKSFTLADFQKYMPGYVARFKQYGVDVSFAISENTKNVGETGKGKLWYIPFQFGSASFPASKVPNNFSKPSPNAGPTGGMFRDDLLKKVYPTAKTEAEFREMMVAKNGKLVLDDMIDFPMGSWADLYKYGKAVKALNAKVGEKPVIALCGLIGSSEAAYSFYEHLTTATGYGYKGNFWWMEPPLYLRSVQKSPELREQARWFNRFYNEGLLDPEIFVMRNDQYT
jgi:ABC-type glycerol-3-phosphate transport system substrate-binding protein